MAWVIQLQISLT
uniref:Uncharacterized protein n=1 Tax=Lepeophtheirus salmonis TaxID=72036 RepID=A0A0K2TWT4_LEPSM